MLSYLPGRVVDIDTEMLTEKQLTSIVSGTRSFHEAVTGLSHEWPCASSSAGVKPRQVPACRVTARTELRTVGGLQRSRAEAVDHA